MSNQMMGAIILGLVYSLMVLGVYISFRILKIPDLTVDGSIVFGMSICAMTTKAGHPYLGLIAAMAGGLVAGLVTGFLQTKAKIPAILAGILTMTGLYSFNLQIQAGSPNVSLLGSETVFSLAVSRMSNMNKNVVRIIVSAIIVLIVTAIVIWFFRTRLGLFIRTTGDNEDMVRASSINADRMKLVALAVANGLVALSGGVYCHYMNYADVTAGSGTVVSGFASVIIGEALMALILMIVGLFAKSVRDRKGSVTMGFISAILGSIAYRVIVALAINANILPSHFLKFITVMIIIIALSITPIRDWLFGVSDKRRRLKENA
ncbi:MAG: ABC transporter permease [Clostridia bacterium]|nr:ABC transporter permease [Clostridia bacterium]